MSVVETHRTIALQPLQVSSCQAPPQSSVNSSQTQHNRSSTDEEPETFPDGGLEAMLVLFGCSCAGFCGLALLNCPGTLQAWLAEEELSGEGVARLGWIFGFYTFMSFFSGIQIGPVFDAYGPRGLSIAGSGLMLATYLLLGVCKTYWQFFVTLGICGGIGSSMLLTCAVSTVQLWFHRYRGVATAVALCGGSIAGIVFPLVLRALFQRIGFSWTLRAVALMIAPFLIAACTMMKGRRRNFRVARVSWRSLVFEPRLLMAPDMAITTLGVYLLEWGLFIVLAYLPSYALHQGMSFQLSFQLLTYLNCGSLVGRFVAGFVGDMIGRFNTQIMTIAVCCVSILGIWTITGDSTRNIITFALLFGFACGSNISLTPVCVGQLCGVGRYGRTYTAVYTVSSIGALTGIPIAGVLLEKTGGQYRQLILFSGLSYSAALLCFIVVRIMKRGWNFTAKF